MVCSSVIEYEQELRMAPSTMLNLSPTIMTAIKEPNNRPSWYCASFEARFSLEMRILLEEYSGIPPDEVDDHAMRIVSLPLTVNPI